MDLVISDRHPLYGFCPCPFWVAISSSISVSQIIQWPVEYISTTSRNRTACFDQFLTMNCREKRWGCVCVFLQFYVSFLLESVWLMALMCSVLDTAAAGTFIGNRILLSTLTRLLSWLCRYPSVRLGHRLKGVVCLVSYHQGNYVHLVLL